MTLETTKLEPWTDPVRLEILWQRLLTIIEEASWAIIRTSFSTAVRESKDFGCLLYDRRGRMLGQNVTTAAKIGVWHTVLPKVFELYPITQMKPGDVFITNDPWLTEGHLYDTTVIAPVFHRGHVIGFAECIAHLSDIGGSMRSDAHDLYEEGLQIPIVRIRESGEEVAEIVRFIATNVRTPEPCLGDIRAMIVCLGVMARKLVAFIDENDLPDIDGVAEAIIERTAAAMRAGIQEAIHPGTYTYEITTDGYRKETTLKASVAVSSSGVTVDYSGSSPQSPFGINCCWNYVYGWTTFALKAIACPDGPVNAGTFEVINVIAPEGSVLNPTRGAPVRMRAATGQLIPQLIYGALATASERAIVAEGASPLWIQRMFATDASGTRVAEMTMCSGGTGARPGADGRDAHSSPANAGNTPIEVLERVLPVQFAARGIIPDTGGRGTYRGGNGQRVAFRIHPGATVRVLFQHERIRHPARGVAGGRPGATGRTIVNGREVDGISEFTLVGGDEVVLELPGGGGFGSPEKRDPQLEARDNADGLMIRRSGDESGRARE